MTKQRSSLLHHLCRFRRRAVLFMCVTFMAAPAYADDPFDMEPSSWMSFDRYKDKPSNWIAPETRAQAELEPVIVAAPTLPPDMPVITTPVRPLVAPAMPGINKDFDVRVSSTADDNPLSHVQDHKPDAPLPQESWKDAVKVAHDKTLEKAVENEDGSQPLNVRSTFLPAMMTPAPKLLAAAGVKKPDVALLTPVPEPRPPITPAPAAIDAAACAAIDAYNKHQLAAIESDRQTLAALQSAIAQLGLQKQLDFMTGANGSMKMQEAATPAAVDLPVGKN